MPVPLTDEEDDDNKSWSLGPDINVFVDYKTTAEKLFTDDDYLKRSLLHHA